ncbi:MAG: putative GatB/YqeY [Candidatus Saccharibacteria bacterium]|nr:putative GatB/YqeY [Candidatus Saccharibacteria bacterium]
MALKAQLDNDIKAALLSGDRFVTETLRGLKAAVLNEEVAAGLREDGIGDEAFEKIVAREIKKRNESALTYDGADRTDLAETERAEADILSRYLPEQVTEEVIQQTVQRIVAELGVSGPAAMGQVIGAVKKELGNSADGATVAKIVKDALQ